MADYLVPKLPNKTIPLVKDCDRAISVNRRDADGDPLDWNASIYMLIDISRTSPTRVDGVVNGPVATLKVEAETANSCKAGTTWRVVMSQTGSPSTETPLLVGTFERNDGK